MGVYDLKGRDVLSLADYSYEDLSLIFNTAIELKRGISRGEYQDHILRSKAAAMIYETPSSRTRMSFWRARPSSSMSRCASRAMYDPSPVWTSELISANVRS